MTLVLGGGRPEVRRLADDLGGELVELPPLDGTDPGWSWAGVLEDWRRSVVAGSPDPRVVVAVWSPSPSPAPAVVAETDLDDWVARAEQPIARWAAALGCAARRVADGGTIVAAVERPPPVGSAGWGPESAVADAVEALVRSLALSEAPRRVRVNAVAAPSPDAALAGVVGLLLADGGGGGVTGTVSVGDG